MIKPPTREELSALVEELALGVAADELSDYEEIVGILVSSLNAAAEVAVDPDEPPRGIRDPGRRPEPGEDPLNAIARWCHVHDPRAKGPLSGKRVGVKDCIAVAGVPMSFGSPLLENYTPRRDSAVVERILAAGGEIVAITNMDDLASAPSGETCRYGRIRNPVDPARITGGSSGGSAAALHYDRIDVTLGTDTGGSIRDPSAFCGVVGLKATFGLIPMAGVGALDETIDHVGPLARSTEDLAALLGAIAGPHPDDPLHRDVRTEDYAAAVAEAADDLKGFRIGIVAEGFGEQVGASQSSVQAVRGVIDRMAELGATVTEVSVPEHLVAGDLLYAIYVEGACELWSSGGIGYGSARHQATDFADAFGAGFLARRSLVSADVKGTMLAGEWLRRARPGSVYTHAQRARPQIRRGYDRVLADHDLLILPTTPFVAFEATEVGVLERVTRSWAAEANTAPFDLTGHPALSIPLAEVDGLPQGVMAIGRHFQEARLLSFAATCERSLGLRPPPPSSSGPR
jgi:amidase